MTKSIYVTTSFIGFHKWAKAPEVVAFLRNLHRHVFGVRLQVSVSHSDRDVEFFILKGKLNEYIEQGVVPTLHANPGQSCEMMAESIAAEFIEQGYNVEEVEVNEDGENGGIVRFEKGIDEQLQRQQRPGGLLR